VEGPCTGDRACDGCDRARYRLCEQRSPRNAAGRGAQRYVCQFAVRPGRRAVVFCNHDGGHDAALALHGAGIEIAAIIDARPAEAPGRFGNGASPRSERRSARQRGDVVRELPAFALGNEVEHHVERGRASGARTAIAVDDKNVRSRADARKFLGECREALPVQRAAVDVEQTRAREHVGTQADASERRASMRQAAEPLAYRGIASTGVARSGADEQEIERGAVADRPMHRDIDARCSRGLACRHANTVASRIAARRANGWPPATARSPTRTPSSGIREQGRSRRRTAAIELLSPDEAESLHERRGYAERRGSVAWRDVTAALAGCSVLWLLAVIPHYAKPDDRIYRAICVLEIAVLLLAASGVLTPRL